jgi:hypothetical protein
MELASLHWSGRAPAPSASKAGKGRRRRGARHVPETRHYYRRHRHRYRQELVSCGGSRSAWRDAIVLRQKWSRRQVEARLANMPRCLIGMEACVGAHHLSRKLISLGHDARLMPAKYVRPYSRGQKNDFRDAEAIAEAVQRPTMKFQSHRPQPATLALQQGIQGLTAAPPNAKNYPSEAPDPGRHHLGMPGRLRRNPQLGMNLRAEFKTSTFSGV